MIGGLWNTLFGWGGLLSFKIAGVLIFWATAFFVYKIYGRPQGILKQKNFLWAALALGMVLHFAGKITVLHYNNISMLTLTICAFFLFLGLERSSPVFFFCSGAALTLAALARLPNICALAFTGLILYNGVVEKIPFPRLTRDLLSFFAGMAAALTAALAIMKALGHLELYLNSLGDLLFSSKEEFTNYGSNDMVKRFLRHWAKALLIASAVFGFSCLVNLASRRSPVLRRFFFIAAAMGMGALSYWYGWQKSDEFIIFSSAGLIALSCGCIILFLDRTFQKQKLLSVISILLICTLSTGSDTGMTVGAYGIIFGLPLVFWFWYEAPELSLLFSVKEKNKENRRQVSVNLGAADKKNIIGLILVLYTSYGIPLLLRDVYRDNSIRWKMTAPVNHPLLRGEYTTEERAAAIEALMEALEKYVRPGDYLLSFESIPMVHFLMGTKPYLYNSWPILYLPTEFRRALDKARLERPLLPVIVLAKVQIRSKTWPDSGGVSPGGVAAEDRKILLDFIEEKNYRTAWESAAFHILIPPGVENVL
ncbi:MAG: hypothetical protein LBO65_04160 [Spirochaetaceae bacterium]|nr:hypothetical protein [Spirochaetaceae bacterium]